MEKINDFIIKPLTKNYTKYYYENIMIFKEITIMSSLKIINLMFFTKESYCVFH